MKNKKSFIETLKKVLPKTKDHLEKEKIKKILKGSKKEKPQTIN